MDETNFNSLLSIIKKQQLRLNIRLTMRRNLLNKKGLSTVIGPKNIN
jgi:hypothetical protein